MGQGGHSTSVLRLAFGKSMVIGPSRMNTIQFRRHKNLIRLIGPGGAGKSTVGLALANRMGIPFVDLDEQFTIREGNISAYLEAHGYEAYANRNIRVYLDTLRSFSGEAVLALSSGFMTYSDDAYSAYRGIWTDIVAGHSTAVLLPSFDFETCVTETVRRQLERSFSRSADREEQVIRTRFGVYWGLPGRKFETTRPIEAVVDDLMTHLLPNIRLQPTAAGAI
jgi:shikimate kinase